MEMPSVFLRPPPAGEACSSFPLMTSAKSVLSLATAAGVSLRLIRKSGAILRMTMRVEDLVKGGDDARQPRPPWSVTWEEAQCRHWEA